jgi:hypothetical protein
MVYTAITLNTVPCSRFSELLRAKVCLGTLITLYDDFADRPSQSNPQLLEILYQLSFSNQSTVRSLLAHHDRVVEFAKSLFKEIRLILTRQPNYQMLCDVLEFDLRQFYSANQFSSLMMKHHNLNNLTENRLYSHHNMGMVIVGMFDLMAIDRLDLSELGVIREVFVLGQRLGRILNVLTTYEREVSDGDRTGELSCDQKRLDVEAAKHALTQEIDCLYNQISRFDSKIKNVFSREVLRWFG